MIQQIGEQPSKVFPVSRQSIQFGQRGLNFTGEDGPAQAQDLTLSGEAEHGKHVRLLDFVTAKADKLVEGGFGVAHGAIRTAGDSLERGFANFHLLQLRDVSEVFGDERARNPAQIKPLAA